MEGEGGILNDSFQGEELGNQVLSKNETERENRKSYQVQVSHTPVFSFANFSLLPKQSEISQG